MSKIALQTLAVLVIIMGIAAMVPSWTWSSGPGWYGITKIVIGVIAFAVAYADKK